MSWDSDIDLLVVVHSCPDPRKLSVTLGRAFDRLEFPIDVTVVEQLWFEETKDVIGRISYPANKYGKVIYENT